MRSLSPAGVRSKQLNLSGWAWQHGCAALRDARGSLQACEAQCQEVHVALDDKDCPSMQHKLN